MWQNVIQRISTQSLPNMDTRSLPKVDMADKDNCQVVTNTQRNNQTISTAYTSSTEETEAYHMEDSRPTDEMRMSFSN